MHKEEACPEETSRRKAGLLGSKAQWRATSLVLIASGFAGIYGLTGVSQELDDDRDGVVSTMEMVNRSVLMVGRILCCIIISEVIAAYACPNGKPPASKGEGDHPEAMFAANWLPERATEKEQDGLLLDFLETTYSRMPLPDLEPAPEIQRVDRKKRPMKTMQLDRPVARSIAEIPILERRNSSPAEILKLTLMGKKSTGRSPTKSTNTDMFSEHPEEEEEEEDEDEDEDLSGVEKHRLECFTELVNNLHQWNFDMFRVSEATTEPLVFVGYGCLDRCGGVHLDKLQLVNFLRAVEDHYQNVPYHNSLHGAAVGRLVFSLCKTAGLGRRLPSLMQFALVLAGLVHDVGHPGLTASFLTKAADEMAVKYNEQSPLENMHLAVTFKLLHENQFLDSEVVTTIRGVLIRTVLGTDMAKHAEQIARLDALIENFKLKDKARCPWYWPSSPPGYYSQEEREVWEGKMQQEFIMEVFLHAADIGTPTLPFEQYLKWNELVRQEFHAQGDRECAEFGCLISPPGGFDRDATPLALHKFDRFFLRFLSLPTFEKLHDLATISDAKCVASGVDLTHCLSNLRENVQRWDEITPEE